MKRTTRGFTLVEIMIVVAIIGILISIAIPGFLRARETSRGRACEENLQKIEGAIEQWALEHNIANLTIAGDLVDYVGSTNYIKRTPICGASGSYFMNAVGGSPTCDYFTTAEFRVLHTLGT